MTSSTPLNALWNVDYAALERRALLYSLYGNNWRNASMQLKPSQARELLLQAAEIKEPVAIVGMPGIGKTAIAGQAAAEAEADFIVSHPALDDPTDGKGLPWPTTDKAGKTTAQFVPIGQFDRVLRATRPTWWLLDDFLQANDSVQKTYMQWLHGRECAGHRLPDHVQIIIATNDRTHRAGAGGMLEPIKSRCTIVELVADMEEWNSWLLGQTAVDGVEIPIDLIAEQVAFMKFRGTDLFCQFQPNTDLKNSPNPRTWVKSLKYLTRNMSAEVEMAALAGVVGEAAATERMAFRRMYKELPTVDSILIDPTTAKIPTNPSVLYAISRAVATRVNETTFPRATKYAQRLVEANYGEFATLMLLEVVRRKPALQQTPAFVRLMEGPLGQLIGGTA